MRPGTLQLRGWNVVIFFVLCLNTLLSNSSPIASLGGDPALYHTLLHPKDDLFVKNVEGKSRSIPELYLDLGLADASPKIQALQPDISGHYFRRSIVDPRVVYNNSLNAATAKNLPEANKHLYKIYPEVRTIYLAMALIPAFIMCYGAFSSFIRSKLHLGEAMLAVTFGIVLGPHVSGLLDPRSWDGGASFNEVTLEITRIIVALDVFSVGVELPAAYILRHWRTMVCLLGPVLLAGWFITGAFILIFVPALSYLEALVIAACISPTDVLLASSVVGKGRYAKDHVPSHLRHLLQAEAGANDGVAIILLYLTLFLLLRNDYTVAHAIGSWVLITVLYHIMVGIVIGAVAGIIARKTLKFSGEHSLIDNESMVPMYISLALLTAGVCVLSGTDDIVAAFACGTAFGWDGWFSEEIEASNFSAIISNLVNTFVFIFVGATIPFKAWNDAILTLVGWKMFLLVICILLLRRLPVMFLLRKLIPELRTTKEALFCAHFGPVGVSGLFISFLATKKLPVPSIPAKSGLDILALTIQPILYLLIFCSVFVHGLSIPFFTITKSIRSRANSVRRSGSLSSGNRPSTSRHRRSTSYRPSTSNQRPSISIGETSTPNTLPKVNNGVSSVDCTTTTRSDTLQFHPRYLSPVGPLSPLLPNLGMISPFQPILKPHDAGPREPKIAHPRRWPDQSSDEPTRAHVPSYPIISGNDETSAEVGPLLPPSSSQNSHLRPGDSPRSNRLTVNSSRNSVRSLSFWSDTTESEAQVGPTDRTSTSRESEIQDGEQDDTYFTSGCNQNGKNLDRRSTVTDARQSDERIGEELHDALPTASLAYATRLQAHSIVLRPRRFSGRAPRRSPRASRRISIVPEHNPLEENIRGSDRQTRPGSALSSSPSTHSISDTPGPNGSPARFDASQLEPKAHGQNPTGVTDTLERRFNSTRNIEDENPEEMNACPGSRSAGSASPSSKQNLPSQRESNREATHRPKDSKPFYSRMLSFRSADPSTGCGDRYTMGTQSMRRESRAFEAAIHRNCKNCKKSSSME
ncbi:hypothetical protein PTTG_02563 [Puccinia triticina 1-1 BBBD Race 1]|uniref:Na_H_Exchanger domain-containing protein n=2 Tax=Puccinia triticina TaxID=208348 RepID=A0A180G743_PUCT1|nr:uncharacterized protein PtA15_9A14 [Puccinia triticina]OAV88515.1 hypothetical protein PTTG_02563 [Puccinia triticina 1-1 BBBD Race 1]WAQ87890.1 hypothetical protein PtA15_9A14 [Puccinia triticina]WAR60078.1 hypothetical protein PtB15_9B15 [Puccinia triticina]